LSLRELLNRFIAVCNVVEYAHSRGIIHRDLKPANILLGAFGETIVVDWGLGKVVSHQDDVIARTSDAAAGGSASNSCPSETLPGTIFGTPAFMSPEQAAGRLDLVGPASDVYSLGATLYSVLTGQPPIPDSNVAVVLRKARSGEIVPPCQVHRGLSMALDAICLKAMALNPNDRYATPGELAKDLECWMADEPVSVYREPISVRLTRWGRRNRTTATGIGVLLVTAVAALAVGTVLLGWANERTEGQRALADQEKHRAELKTAEVKEKAEALEQQLYVNRVNLAHHEYQNDVAQAEALLDQCPPRLRGWEWNYLKRLCHLDLATIRGHTLGVNAVAISKDGTRLISGGAKQEGFPSADDAAELILWDMGSRREIRRFDGLRGRVYSVAFSPDGRLVATGSGYSHPISEGHLSLWDTETGKLVFDKATRYLSVLTVAFSPDGKTLAAGLGNDTSNDKGRLMLWKIPSGERLEDLPLKVPGGVQSLAFSPDGKMIATANSELVELWKREPLRRTGRLKGHTNWIYTLAFSPDGKRLATGGWDKTIKVWNLETEAPVRNLEGHLSFVDTLDFSPDGRRLASGGADHTIRIWDATSGQNEIVLRGHALGVAGLCFTRDGNHIVSASHDRTLKYWDATSDQQTVLRNHNGWVNSVVFSPDGRKLATGSGDKRVMIWDVEGGRLRKTLTGWLGWVNSVAFNPAGDLLAAAGEYNGLQVWDAASGTVIKSIEHLDNYVRGVAFSPDGTRLAACTGAHDYLPELPGVVYVWKAATREQELCFRGHTGRVLTLAFSPDSSLIASGGTPGKDVAGSTSELLLWDARTGDVEHRLVGHFQRVNCVVFSHDGLWLASGSEDGEVRIWDVTSGTEVKRIKVSSQGVLGLAFHPDGSRLATASYEPIIKLFNPRTGEKILDLPGHTAGVVALSFSPDGRRLASGSIDWSARIWDGLKPSQVP
jgi:WD40 repeat protein